MSSHATVFFFFFFFEQIYGKLVEEKLFGAIGLEITVGKCLREDIKVLLFDTVLGCRLETERHKIESRTKGICSLNTYFNQ